MIARVAVLLTAVFVTFASPSAAQVRGPASSPIKVFGVMDDGPHIDLAANNGFNTVKKTFWLSSTNRHLNDVDHGYLRQFDAELKTAEADNLSVIIELWPGQGPRHGKNPPLRPNQWRGVCDVARDLAKEHPEVTRFEIGIEPNNYAFWKPQFASGRQVSAAAYEGWVATCYDRLKSVNPAITVIGGSLASHGEDLPQKVGSNTSPTLFIEQMCRAYRHSRRTRPLMDWLDMHSYQSDSPATKHPRSTTITIADRGKLNKLLDCFSGTAQPKPPVLWGESGYETVIPAGEHGRYRHDQREGTFAVSEPTQGQWYATSIQMAYCDPTSVGFVQFLLVDESKLSGWQSGLYYATGPRQPQRAKLSRPTVHRALVAATGGAMNCGSPGPP